jgi:hypothetical protein
LRKATKPPSGSKTGSRAAPSKRAPSAKASKSSAAKWKAAKKTTAPKSKTAAVKAKAKKSAKAKPAKPAARAPGGKGCCIIRYRDGREEARNGVTQQQCHDIEVANPATVAATHWQSGVCA